MRTDHQSQSAVMHQLDYDPSINASHIGVAARGGVVTLSGHVPSLLERTSAERLAGRVKGVKGVVNAVEIDLPGHCLTSDERIAELAHGRLASNASVPAREHGLGHTWRINREQQHCRRLIRPAARGPA